MVKPRLLTIPIQRRRRRLARRVVIKPGDLATFILVVDVIIIRSSGALFAQHKGQECCRQRFLFPESPKREGLPKFQGSVGVVRMWSWDLAPGNHAYAQPLQI